MEVFIRNLPEQTTEQGLRKFFKPYLEELCISIFSCDKMQRARIATLTFLYQPQGLLFLMKHGQHETKPGSRVNYPSVKQLYIMGTPIYCTASIKAPDVFQLRCLENEARAGMFRSKPAIGAGEEALNPQKTPLTYNSSSASCGVWSYEGSELVFISHVQWMSIGEVKFGARRMVLSMGTQRIEFAYSWIKNITVGGHQGPSMTITCRFAPKFSEKTEEELEALLKRLNIRIKLKEKKKASWKRLSSLGADHQRIVSSCLVYRINISSPFFNEQIRKLKISHELPPAIYLRTHVRLPQEALAIELGRLQQAFTSSVNSLPFAVMFQMQKLAQDGYLSPSTVVRMVPEVILMLHRSGTPVTVSALRKLFLEVPYRGPEAEAHEFHVDALLQTLRKNEERAKREELYSGLLTGTSESDNIANIYRAMVTPAGVYLYGPEPETKNRVLRKYNDHLDYFLRVQFCDEDGQQVRFDPRTSNEDVFNVRFKKVLEDGINIAGRTYGFLGFSHSSLRSQTCWFMAPFVYNGKLQLYQLVIANLGDFSHIHSPAKCAARIGQAFSDTPNAVSLGSIVVTEVPDVERNGRVFSDGVGTFSESVLHHIWDALPSKRLVKPTAFQIRFSGAKGMISLDSRIKGHDLFIRPSMIKFSGSDSTDIELCGAAYHPLPMFLNRQTIKIMEDLGVADNFFLNLQANAVEKLRKSTLSTLNASKFLAAHSVGEKVRLPWFMKQLFSLNLSFHQDAFLRDVVELSVLVELRELKHRGRILVENGATLYGIMDETGVLEEGQVFIILDAKPGVSKVVTGGNLIVTRSPTLHPGDVQLVTAVSVPDDSPLMKLANCICFSQKGMRDLPSQLGGGDLDGDLFNVIWDMNARPTKTYDPADYPRQQAIDIGRSVTRHDMTTFFVEFMATDQLGRIATLHKVLADQREHGTLDNDCLKLASMHSTAVDFSKTGIPVDLSNMPRYSRCRPDFMAPGPHVTIIKKQAIAFVEEKFLSEEADDDDDLQAYRYYESDKINGKLYRAIDEREVFKDIQQIGISETVPGIKRRSDYSNTHLMDQVWEYVTRRCKSLHWEHLLEWARDIRDWYDECVLSIMSEYSEHPLRPLSELEVFVGNILGKTGKQSKQQRDLSTTMKERVEKDAAFLINNIVKDGAEPSMEALERSVACFEVSFETGRIRKKSEELVSFKYVAAAVCLREMERCSGGRLRMPLHESFVPERSG